MLPSRSSQLVHRLRQSYRNASSQSALAVPLTDPIDYNTSGKRNVLQPPDVKLTKLENGISVASVDHGGSVSRLAVSLRTGSRHEMPGNAGISQLMKTAAFISNGERSSLRTVREMQQIGGTVQCSVSREAVTRQTNFLRSNLSYVFENMSSAYLAPKFTPWELTDVKKFCHLENEAYNENQTAVNFELLHKAAFRDGVGNPLYSNNFKIDALTIEQLDAFAKENYTGEQIVITGTDIDHNELVRTTRDFLGNLLQGASGQSANQQKYYGGEAHKSTLLGFAYASLVAEGAGYFHVDLPALMVLQKVLGSGTYVKWGSSTISSRLNKVASGVTTTPFLANTLNLSYSDCGLFGFHVVANPESITKVLKSAISQVGAVSKGELTSEDLMRAQNQVKSSILMHSESKEDLLDDLTKQVMFSGSYISPMEAAAKVDGVTTEKVSQVSKRVFGGKASLVVSGDTSHAPYIDDLL